MQRAIHDLLACVQHSAATLPSGDTRRPLVEPDTAVRLRRVISRLARAMNESASTEDLTPSQASLLGVVVGKGAIRMSALARLEGLNPTMVSRVVGQLEGKGLVVRSQDPTDQRVVIAEPTERGRDTSERIRHRRTEDLLAVIDELPVPTAAMLVAALPALEDFTEALRTPATTLAADAGRASRPTTAVDDHMGTDVDKIRTTNEERDDR